MRLFKLIRVGLPMMIFLGVMLLLWRGLTLHPAQIPSPLINKPAPQYRLPNLLNKKMMTERDLIGHVTLLNVWASWCEACAEEQSTLVAISQNKNFQIIGLDYKDNLADAKKWLQQYGNPYEVIAVDQTGNSAIDWGVYGTPETFVIDKKGIIRYKYIGPISMEVWEDTLRPVIEKLS